jgi:hypothetical protein
MADYVLGIKFTGPINSGETVSFSWSGVSGPVTTASETFVPVRSASLQTTIASPTNNIQQAINLYDAVVADYTPNFNVSRINNIVFISSKNTSNPMSGSTTASGITFTNGIIDLVTDVMARSPYFIFSEENNFDKTRFILKAFEGNLFTGNTAPITYQLTKQKLLSIQDKIYINVNNLIKERLEADVSSFFDSATTVGQDLPIAMSKWAEVEITTYFNDVVQNTTFERLFVLDGYIYPTEQQGMPEVLITGNKRYISSNQVQRLYFKTVELLSASGTAFTSTGSTTFPITYSDEPQINTKYVQSIKVANDLGVRRLRYTFVYTNETVVIDYEVYEECLYEPYTIIYKNKWGVLESMQMDKKASKELTITNNDLNRSIVDYNGNFDINRHTKKQFNTNGKEKYTLNTQFLPEYMNQAVEELSLSEELWLVKDNVIYPIIRTNDNIAFKTRLNDKLIQYTMEVELSHAIVKNIV